MKITRRQAFSGALAAGSAAALAAPSVHAQQRFEWKMVTSWPKNLPGPGVTAQYLADRIGALSGGRLTVRLYAEGELVPALETFAAVSNGTAEMAHTAPLFWTGRYPAAPLFTAAPYGLIPLEHMTWIYHGGGQALWDELYAEAGVKPYMAGNTGYQMGGWYKREITSLADVRGLKIRMPGLGGAVMERLGAVPVSLAPGEIFSALQSGLIDATEFLGPFSDSAMGFFRVAKNYYYPGFHEPNGTGEALVSIKAMEALPDDLKAVIETACAEANIRSLTEAEWQNASALRQLQKDEGVTLRKYPDDVLAAARTATSAVMAELTGKDALSRKIVESYHAAANHLGNWSDVSVKSYLAAREG